MRGPWNLVNEIMTWKLALGNKEDAPDPATDCPGLGLSLVLRGLAVPVLLPIQKYCGKMKVNGS